MNLKKIILPNFAIVDLLMSHGNTGQIIGFESMAVQKDFRCIVLISKIHTFRKGHAWKILDHSVIVWRTTNFTRLQVSQHFECKQRETMIFMPFLLIFILIEMRSFSFLPHNLNFHLVHKIIFSQNISEFCIYNAILNYFDLRRHVLHMIIFLRSHICKFIQCCLLSALYFRLFCFIILCAQLSCRNCAKRLRF